MGKLRVLRFTLPRFDLQIVKPLARAKHTDKIYSTPEFRRWRATVIRQADGRCEWTEHGKVCGVRNPRMYADHVVELSDGGAAYDVSNGQCLCGRHHAVKTALVRKQRQAWQSRGVGGLKVKE